MGFPEAFVEAFARTLPAVVPVLHPKNRLRALVNYDGPDRPRLTPRRPRPHRRQTEPMMAILTNSGCLLACSQRTVATEAPPL